jgi:hypothetical protein
VHAGSEVRMPNIFVKDYTPYGVSQGAFEYLSGHKTSLEFVLALSAAAKQNHGWAGPMFLRAFMADRDESIEFARKVLKNVTRWIMMMIPPANRQAGRVAEKFPALAAGGALATHLGVTGWHVGEAEDAALRCFEMWFEQWPGAAKGFGASQIIEHARRMIQAQSARFEGEWEPYRLTDDQVCFRDPKIRDRLGYKMSDSISKRTIYHMEPQTFDEYFKLFGNRATVAKALFDAGMLLARDKQDPKRMYQTQRRSLAPEPVQCGGFSIALPVGEHERVEEDEPASKVGDDRYEAPF